ncbi:MAG TPA: universal stress protein [Pyrinomonadaceae bacterium]|nr:universal stress protein [Pyrinomonadaceae bacterium]
MNDLFKLVIGYDGSHSSDAALNDLKRAGLPERADALVVTVADVFPPPEDDLAEDDMLSPGAAALVAHSQAEARKAVEHAMIVAQRGARRVKADFPGWDVRVEADGDSPAWALIKLASQLDADLIVVGSHGHSSAGGRVIMGSVSLRVLYETSCSVRIARCVHEQNADPARIIVGFDGSKESEAAVNTVASRSWPEGTEIRVITAREALTPDEQNFLTDRFRAAGLAPSELSRNGDPAHVLVTEAVEWDADAIFVGTRDLHGFRHLLQGSVSSAVAAHARCSVEVVRAARAAAARSS